MEPIQDESNSLHHLVEKIAEDGQGILYNTQNKGIILRTSQGRDTDRQCYDDVKILPLSSIKNIALPISYLQAPSIGYTIAVPESYIPLNILESGGLKRRLLLLSELAKILIQLHYMPAMYGSISPTRIFVSPSLPEICLLYSVKMGHAMQFAQELDSDPYISPEAKAGSGGTILSDSYVFAALARDMLDGFAISEELDSLLEHAMSDTPTQRPRILEIHQNLIKQADCLLTCKSCQAGFDYELTVCPSCQTPAPKMIKARIYDKFDKVNGRKSEQGVKVLEIGTGRQFFWNYHTENTRLLTPPEPRIECHLQVNAASKKLEMVFVNHMSKPFFIEDNVFQSGEKHVVPLPFDNTLSISFLLYDEKGGKGNDGNNVNEFKESGKIKRYIDLVMS